MSLACLGICRRGILLKISYAHSLTDRLRHALLQATATIKKPFRSPTWSPIRTLNAHCRHLTISENGFAFFRYLQVLWDVPT